jgi:hypothetical protein
MLWAGTTTGADSLENDTHDAGIPKTGMPVMFVLSVELSGESLQPVH